MSHSDVFLCISRSMHIIYLLTTANTSISDEIYLFIWLYATYHYFFFLFLTVWGDILSLSAQSGWMLHCFKWKIILCNPRNTAKSDFFKSVQEVYVQAWLEYGGIRFLIKSQKYKYLYFFFCQHAILSCYRRNENSLWNIACQACFT